MLLGNYETEVAIPLHSLPPTLNPQSTRGCSEPFSLRPPTPRPAAKSPPRCTAPQAVDPYLGSAKSSTRGLTGLSGRRSARKLRPVCSKDSAEVPPPRAAAAHKSSGCCERRSKERSARGPGVVRADLGCERELLGPLSVVIHRKAGKVISIQPGSRRPGILAAWFLYIISKRLAWTDRSISNWARTLPCNGFLGLLCCSCSCSKYYWVPALGLIQF